MSASPVKKIATLLVANRGEIACRIFRTARELGLRTVAVYSDADRDAMHVGLADDAVGIGPAPAADSYLNIEALIAAAKHAGADAVHPGYGFLSENGDFARACAAAGLVFVGPGADAIDLMGSKAAARRRMQAAGVPCLPGYDDADQSDAALTSAAGQVGFPVMIKAAAGGGGRGMRRVMLPQEFAGALALARSEALSAFGSDEMILERALLKPRHVEVQVLADAHGNVVHLGERDCSVQRRHQKVIEEAPCPAMTAALRERMGQAAVTVARDIAYRGAGTVEFLLDADGAFYFMEMNTRLQVEHPVTECITGRDLVADQLRIAQGEPLGFSQDQVSLTGHAIEVRLYAEDPAAGFLPDADHIDWLALPSGNGVRVDAGVRTGDTITAHYDPLVAKIIVAGDTREQALYRLQRALECTTLFGPACNRDFLLDALHQTDFVEGTASTAFIEQHYPEGRFKAAVDSHTKAAAAVTQHCALAERAMAASVCVSSSLRDWSSGPALHSVYSYATGNALRVVPLGDRRYRVSDGDADVQVDVLARSDCQISLRIAGEPWDCTWRAPDERTIHLATRRATLSLTNSIGQPAPPAMNTPGGSLAAPMHGVVLSLDVTVGDGVAKGQRLAVLEAMKMQHELLADSDGVVAAVHAAEGAQVSAGDPLLELASADSLPSAYNSHTSLPQADDFLAESEALYQLLASLEDADFEHTTQFKQWTVNDVLTHLHAWNQAAGLSLHDEEALASFLGKARIAMASGDLRDAERAFTQGLKGKALLEQWIESCRATAHRFATADPKARVKWAGPDMSVRSSITARLMETWAHGQALYDMAGVERKDADRIRNIVVLGINTFEWNFKNRGEKAPGAMPRLTLTAPSGELWEWNTDNTTDSITGPATEFCQVITQVRNAADTTLEVSGAVAEAWMANAQCFAGPPHPPPAPGTRFCKTTRPPQFRAASETDC